MMKKVTSFQTMEVRNRPWRKLMGILLLWLFTAQVGYSQVRLPKLISNGMILQRDRPVEIWGWASAGENVTLQFRGQSLRTVADLGGNWHIKLPAQKAGGPFEMEISGTNRLLLSDVLFGDVWLCSGQSNMEYPMNRLIDRYSEVIAQCANNQIRQFKVPEVYDFNTPREDYPSGAWVEVNPQTILDFSAVAYFLARDLYAKYQVPMGIINAAKGGSPAEAWISEEGLKEFPHYLAETKKYKDQSFIDQLQRSERKASDDWYALMNQTDKGLSSNPTWKSPATDASSWPTMPVPSFWADHELGKLNGVVWFRKEIEVPVSMTGKPVRLLMGRIVDADSVFINGQLVGSTAYQYPQRNYRLAAGVLQPGINTLVVRVINNSGKGGFVENKPYQLFTDTDTISLIGDWHYQLGCRMNPTPGQTSVNLMPTGLYNGMLAPANKYAIKGAAWYQGETNAGRHQEYQQLLTALITDWRLKRGSENFPFIIAQLPNFMEPKDEPSQSSWASFRNAQLKTLSVANTALTVNIDLGEWNDIHPQNKEEVGKRMALAAQKIAYNEKKVVASGPLYQSMKIKGKAIELSFSESGSGLVAIDGKPLSQFAISGADGKFVWAEAKIRGNKVVVWNEKITKPLAVRYAWADNPAGANLFNAEGLPASPFEAK